MKHGAAPAPELAIKLHSVLSFDGKTAEAERVSTAWLRRCQHMRDDAERAAEGGDDRRARAARQPGCQRE